VWFLDQILTSVFYLLKLKKNFELTFKENSRNRFCGYIILTESTTFRFSTCVYCVKYMLHFRKDILNLIPTTTKKSELFFLSKNLELLSLHHCTKCTAHIDVPFYCTNWSAWRKSTNVGIDKIIFEGWREFIKMARTYNIHYSIINGYIYRPTTQTVWELLVGDESSQKRTAKTQYWKFETNIPRKGTVRHQYKFLHSCFCKRFYVPTIGLSILLQENMWTDPGNT
jgi:hypothetical protein